MIGVNFISLVKSTGMSTGSVKSSTDSASLYSSASWNTSVPTFLRGVTVLDGVSCINYGIYTED